MRALLTLLVISSLVLSGCGRVRDSKLNPGNWFGKSKSQTRASAPAEEEEVNPLIPEQRVTLFRKGKKEAPYEGTPIRQVKELVVEQTSGGALVRVTGVALLQGAFDVRLTSDTDGEPVDGVLTFALEALQPTNNVQGPERSRYVTAARFVSNQTLASVREIRVVGGANIQTSRR